MAELQQATLSFTVGPDDTAAALGSGDLDVLGTPRLLAWCEAATVAALTGLDPSRTSVGTRVQLEHLAATAAGGVLDVTAVQEYSDGRLVRFAVSAVDGNGRLVANGEITRVIVDRARFLARLG